MEKKSINFIEKLSKFSDQWSPKVIAQMNDYHFILAKIEGEFVWHKHDETDEAFIVIDGEMTVDFRDGAVTLEAGEMLVIPKGIEHKTSAERECSILMIEPAGTTKTGDVDAKIIPEDVWI